MMSGARSERFVIAVGVNVIGWTAEVARSVASSSGKREARVRTGVSSAIDWWRHDAAGRAYIFSRETARDPQEWAVGRPPSRVCVVLEPAGQVRNWGVMRLRMSSQISSCSVVHAFPPRFKDLARSFD